MMSLPPFYSDPAGLAGSMPTPPVNTMAPLTASLLQQPASFPQQLQGEVFFMETLTAQLSSTHMGSQQDCIRKLKSLNLDDHFWIYIFKVAPCTRAYAHKWTLCPCAHAGETARRRDPRITSYKAVLCPLVKAKKACPLGDTCNYSHNVFEHWLHPSRYKTRLCSFGNTCNRSICFFAHTTEELRCVPNMDDGKEIDEREFLMQLMVAQENGMLPNLPGMPHHAHHHAHAHQQHQQHAHHQQQHNNQHVPQQQQQQHTHMHMHQHHLQHQHTHSQQQQHEQEQHEQQHHQQQQQQQQEQMPVLYSLPPDSPSPLQPPASPPLTALGQHPHHPQQQCTAMPGCSTTQPAMANRRFGVSRSMQEDHSTSYHDAMAQHLQNLANSQHASSESSPSLTSYATAPPPLCMARMNSLNNSLSSGRAGSLPGSQTTSSAPSRNTSRVNSLQRQLLPDPSTYMSMTSLQDTLAGMGLSSTTEETASMLQAMQQQQAQQGGVDSFYHHNGNRKPYSRNSSSLQRLSEPGVHMLLGQSPESSEGEEEGGFTLMSCISESGKPMSNLLSHASLDPQQLEHVQQVALQHAQMSGGSVQEQVQAHLKHAQMSNSSMQEQVQAQLQHQMSNGSVQEQVQAHLKHAQLSNGSVQAQLQQAQMSNGSMQEQVQQAFATQQAAAQQAANIPLHTRTSATASVAKAAVKPSPTNSSLASTSSARSNSPPPSCFDTRASPSLTHLVQSLPNATNVPSMPTTGSTAPIGTPLVSQTHAAHPAAEIVGQALLSATQMGSSSTPAANTNGAMAQLKEGGCAGLAQEELLALAASAASKGGGVSNAYVGKIMADLQEQGLAGSKEQLVASLSQLLAQLLSAP